MQHDSLVCAQLTHLLDVFFELFHFALVILVHTFFLLELGPESLDLAIEHADGLVILILFCISLQDDLVQLLYLLVI